MVGRPQDDDALVERARRGDLDAYEQLVHQHQTIAFRTACLVADPADAEEAVQDAFLKAYRALGRFRRGAPFRPWLLQIVTNEARNRRRAHGRRAALALRAAEERPEGGAAPSPEGALLLAERRQTLLEALDQLRDEERMVLACRFFLDLDERETAAVLGCAQGTVKSRQSRALARLQSIVEDRDA